MKLHFKVLICCVIFINIFYVWHYSKDSNPAVTQQDLPGPQNDLIAENTPVLPQRAAVVNKTRSLLRLGSSYGGWTIDQNRVNSNSIIYSFGAGMDISWDVAMVEKFGVDIYMFDPTKKSIDYVEPIIAKLGGKIHFFHVGLYHEKTMLNFSLPTNTNYVSMRPEGTKGKIVSLPVDTLENLMKMNNHNHLDVLKIDVEGAEYGVLESYFNSNKELPFDQFLVEWHYRYFPKERHTNALEQLKKNGFEVMWEEEKGLEMGFIKTQ